MEQALVDLLSRNGCSCPQVCRFRLLGAGELGSVPSCFNQTVPEPSDNILESLLLEASGGRKDRVGPAGPMGVTLVLLDFLVPGG